MTEVIHFGTDGWRGKIAEEYTFDNVRRCAQGFANYLLKEGNTGKKVVVGYDRRFDSDHFAAASAEGLSQNSLGDIPLGLIHYSFSGIQHHRPPPSATLHIN